MRLRSAPLKNRSLIQRPKTKSQLQATRPPLFKAIPYALCCCLYCNVSPISTSSIMSPGTSVQTHLPLDFQNYILLLQFYLELNSIESTPVTVQAVENYHRVLRAKFNGVRAELVDIYRRKPNLNVLSGRDLKVPRTGGNL